jgi:tRNA nucleotidyltransferase (CCA-adding enzyme)
LARENPSKNGKGVLADLDDETLNLFKEIGRVASENQMTAYAVGGMLRDLLLTRPSFDLDFVIEGSAPLLAQKLVEGHPKRFALEATHERFQTARLRLLDGNAGGVVDLSTARTEFYEFPAALPTVEPSKLEQDLFRRDFTINAMAVSIVPSTFGTLYDYFNGLDDLHSSLIRILHQFSFIEDPTRLLRAARFAARFDFKLEKNTREQAKRAITIGIFDNLGGSRLKKELKLLLEAAERKRALEILSELGGKLCYLDEHLEYGQAERKAIRRCEKLLAVFPGMINWAVFLALLLSSLPEAQLESVLARLHLTNEERNIVVSGLMLLPKLAAIGKDARPSEIYEVLHGESDEAMVIAVCLAPDDSLGKAVRRMARLYTEELRKIVPETSGQDLLSLGFAQGPKLGQVLKSLLVAKLNGQVTTKHEELEFVKKFAAAEP